MNLQTTTVVQNATSVLNDTSDNHVHVEAKVLKKGNESMIGTTLGESDNAAKIITLHQNGSVSNNTISRDALIDQ